MCHPLLRCIRTWQHLKAAPPKRPRMRVPYPGASPTPGMLCLEGGPAWDASWDTPVCGAPHSYMGPLGCRGVGCSMAAKDVLGKDQRRLAHPKEVTPNITPLEIQGGGCL